jgi:hypothetical protein
MTITSMCHVGVFMAGGLHFRILSQKKWGLCTYMWDIS